MTILTGDPAANPFPGLRAFEEQEEHLFFGRERQVDELLEKLAEFRFLGVIGSSGSGKSSLVKSGLLPSLYRGFMAGAGSAWKIALLRPGNDPIGHLAETLAAPGVLSDEADEDGSRRVITETVLRHSRSGLTDAVKQLRQGQDNILVVVDQFEELFRFSRYEKESQKSGRDTLAFVNLLLEATAQTDIPVYVIITMRSDFLGNCTEFRGLPEAINKGLYLIPRMTREDIRQAITGPVAVGGASISPLLVTRLLNDVGDSPDQLPVLQHALMRTWQSWERDRQPQEPIQVKHYEAIGTMKNALSLHAEEAYEALATPRLKHVCEIVFKALTEKRPDMPGTRRPCIFRELVAIAGATEEEVRTVIEVFRSPDRSFLMPPCTVPLEADTMVDISHESLMRVWVRLVRWVNEEAESSKIYLNLLNAALLYAQEKAGLYRSPELDIALRWRETNHPNEAWGKKFNDQYRLAIQFLEKSEGARKEHLLRLERRKKWRRRRQLLIAAVAVALLCCISAGTTYLLEEQSQLQEEANRKKNIELNRQLDVYRSRSFKALNMSDDPRSDEKMRGAILLSLDAQVKIDSIYRLLFDSSFTHYFDDVNYMALERIFWHKGNSHLNLSATDTITAFTGYNQSAAGIAFTRDSVFRQQFFYDKPLSFTAEGSAFPNSIRQLALSANDEWLVAADTTGAVFYWPAKEHPKKAKLLFRDSQAVIHDLHFSDDQELQLIRSNGDSLFYERYRLPSGNRESRFRFPVKGAALTAINDKGAAVMQHDSITVWEFDRETDPEIICRIEMKRYGRLAPATCLVISRNNERIAWGDSAGHVFGVAVAGTNEGLEMHRISHSGPVTSLCFVKRPDGNLFLASGGNDGSASMVDVRGGKNAQSAKDLVMVNSYDDDDDYLCVSHDGKLLFIRNNHNVQVHIIDLDLLLKQVEYIGDAMDKGLKKPGH